MTARTHLTHLILTGDVDLMNVDDPSVRSAPNAAIGTVLHEPDDEAAELTVAGAALGVRLTRHGGAVAVESIG